MTIDWAEVIKLSFLVLNGLVMPVLLFQVNLWRRQSKLEQRLALTEQKLDYLPDRKSYHDLLTAVQNVEKAVVANRADTAANFKNLDKEMDRIFDTLNRHEDYNKPSRG